MTKPGLAIVFTILVVVGCGKDKAAPPGEALAPPAAVTTPDPTIVCVHANKVIGKAESEEMKKVCISQLLSIKADFGEEVYKKTVDCAMTANTRDDLAKCDPQKMTGVAADSEGSTKELRDSKVTEAKDDMERIRNAAKAYFADPPASN